MKLSPQEERALMVDGYRRNYRRLGVDVPLADLERLAVHDLELVEAERRNPPPRDSKPKAGRPAVENVVEAETGSRLVKPPPAWRPDFLYRDPTKVGDRWAHAVARIKRIQTEGTILSAHGVSFIGALGELAKEYATLYACFLFRNQDPRRRGFVRNIFDGLSDADVTRVYRREVENICDRSTGVLGSWYVK